MIAIITAHGGVASTGTPGKENLTGQSTPAATAAHRADPGASSTPSSSTTSCDGAVPDTKGSIAAAADDDDDRKDNASDDWGWRSRGMPYDVVTIVLQYVEAPPVDSASPALAPASSHDRP